MKVDRPTAVHQKMQWYIWKRASGGPERTNKLLEQVAKPPMFLVKVPKEPSQITPMREKEVKLGLLMSQYGM